jgi:hypothetical protein
MIKLLVYALLAYVAFHFVRKFLNGLSAPAERPAEKAPSEPPRVEAQDLVQCAVCGHYVAARCTRTNCPQ